MSELHYQNVLPPYRSLVNPNITYDYQTHRVIHLSPSDIKKIISRFQSIQSQKPKSALQMKYRSLLSDVSMKAQILNRKVSNLKNGSQIRFAAPSNTASTCRNFKDLPFEIQVLVFSYVDDANSYKNCLYTSKRFYELAKPLLFKSVSFTSTYRFAQFVTCIRNDKALGYFVMNVDLSKLRPGNYDVDEDFVNSLESSPHNTDDAGVYLSQVLAGWRDWKFKNNPHALHPVAIPLSKSHINTTSPVISTNASKRIKLTKYFKRRRSQTNVTIQNPTPSPSEITTTQPNASGNSTHPRINRFLSNYVSAKDLPMGYILHLINICPNLKSLNLENVSISADYRVKRAFQSRYQTYDLVNNLPKGMSTIIDSIAPSIQSEKQYLERSGFRVGFPDISSSASSLFSFNAFSSQKPKYNSLLPPLNIVTPDLHYAKKGDGQVFLSDLSLKSVNTSHLEIIDHSEIFHRLQKRKTSLCYLNMSSMIWINLKLVREFLIEILAQDLSKEIIGGKEIFTLKGKTFEVGQSITEGASRNVSRSSSGLVIDLRNSGMIKNLPWAKIMDTELRSGQEIIYRIINDELVSEAHENIIRERNRRGRIAENYFF